MSSTLSAQPRPRSQVASSRRAEDVARMRGQQVPRNDQTAGGIADAEIPEVDDRARAASDRRRAIGVLRKERS